MPCVVSLENFVKILCVKSSWCENFADTLNYGSQPGRMVKIFYSPDRSDKPDFRLQEPDEFDDTAPACYYGYVLDHFGENVQGVQCGSICNANNIYFSTRQLSRRRAMCFAETASALCAAGFLWR